MQKFRGYLFLLYFAVSIASVIPFLYLFRKRNHRIRAEWAKLSLWLFGIKCHQVGEFDMDAQMLVMNHQSMLDIIALEAIYPKDICWIAKEEIKRLPIYGHIIKAPRMISVVREDKSSLVRLFKEASERLAEGRVLAIFPEGTRATEGELLPFKPGALMLAKKLHLTVQPIVIDGTKKLLDSQRIAQSGGEFKVTALASFTLPEQSNPIEESKRIREMIGQALKC